jgi:N12 class adenine-specific DNA methylase
MATKHTASQLYLPGFNPLSLFAEPPTKSIAVHTAVDAGAAEVAQVISLDDEGVVEVVPTQVAALPEVQPAPTPIAATADEGDDEEADLVPAAPIVPRVEAVQRINLQVSRDQAPWPELPATLHGDLGGKVAKYEANVAALALLQRLEASQAEPTDAERITLSRYTGWGGLKEVFDGYQDWRARKESLLALIGEDAFAQARGSIVNAHYTPMLVVKTMWDAVRAMGFTGGRILEPSSGTGYFFGGMPADIARRSEMTAVELDELSARITKVIYGHAATVHHTGFEKFSSPDGWFDLAITNCPFGSYSVACGRRRAYSKWTIHNYFLGRMLDAVRPGGLVALITSSHFMDSKEHLKRAWVHNRAELVGAVRLPQGAFSRVANTDVVADMLFFRRREAGALPNPGEQAWMQLAEIPQEQMRENVANSMRMRNEFWGANPESVAGRWTLTPSQRGQVLTPVCRPEDFPALLAKASSALPTNVYVPPAAVATPVTKVVSEVRDQANGEKPGSFVMHNDAVHVVTNGVYEPVDTARTRLARIARLIEVRDATRALLTRQLQVDATEAELEGLRRKLNMQYDSMVRQHGWIHSKGNAMAFRQDPDWPLLLSLENYDDEKDVATKAAIFTTRTGKPSTAPVTASTPEDAVAISIAETGHLNPSYLGQLLGLEPDKVMPHLATLSLAFLNPETGLYESREEYLCGNVRNKLRAAEFAGEAYSANVRALQNVIPADLPPGDIDVRLGTPWIPTTDYVEFVRSLEPGAFSSSYVTLDVTYDRLSGVWALKTNVLAGTLNKKWGTAEIDATRIIVEAMNGRQVTVYDVIMVDGNEKRVVNVENTAAAREMQGKVEANFKEWVWADDERSKRLHRLYNDEYNSVVERRFDGSRLRLPGYSWVLAPSEHQLSAVARVSTCNNTLLAHCVGAGKTLSMVMGSMELKRLGLVDKPAHVVPNHMLEQYTAEFLRAYPNANVLMVTKDDLSKERRKAFCARVATGSWDAVILTHSVFELIKPSRTMSEAILAQLLDEVQEALEQLKGDRDARPQIKQLVRMEKEWTARLERANAAWKKDDLISLEEMGIDWIAIDEAHLYKNLFRFSQMERVSGLSTANSQRAFDLYVKTREIMRKHGDRERGCVFATATPIANSMAEFHVMQRYLQPKTLEAAGLLPFDAWAAMFGRTVTSLEVSPDGSTFRMATRFAQFVNMPELMSMFRQVADVRTREMLQLPTPPLKGGGAQVIAAKASAQLKAFIGELVERAEAIRNRSVDPSEDNMLAVTNDGRNAALDLRMIDRSAGFDPEGKVSLCINRAFELWQESASFRGAQLIFCDMGTPTGRAFNLYEDIRQRLIAKGVPSTEIAFIHEAATDAAKASLFKKVREGLVRFLLGSTAKMGIGTNVQTRLYGLHHLDVPWRPCDLEQRDGRIERRGNLCDAVYIYRYVTEGSFDAYSWQTVSAKCRFIDQVMAGDATQRRVEDISATALSYEEVKAIACGNPVVREKALLDAEFRKLSLLASHHYKSVRNAKWVLQDLQGSEKKALQEVEAIEADNALIKTCQVLEMDGVTYKSETEIWEALSKKMKALREQSWGDADRFEVMRFDGLPVRLIGGGTMFVGDYQAPFGFYIGEKWRQKVAPYLKGEKVLAQLMECVSARPKDLEYATTKLASVRRQRPMVEMQASSTFEHTERMAEVRKRIDELELELGLAKEDAGMVAVGESAAVVNNTSVQGEEAADDVDGVQADEAAEAV